MLTARNFAICFAVRSSGAALPAQYRDTLALVLADPDVDSVIVIYIPVLPGDAAEIAAAIRDCTRSSQGKTVLATFMGASGVPAPLDPVPAYPFPERAVLALAATTRYAAWRQMPAGEAVHFNAGEARLRSIIDPCVERGGGWLDPLEADSLLIAMGIRTSPLSLAQSPNDAMEAAMRMRFPVALKAFGPDLLHKSDVGGVRLSLADECSVYDAFLELKVAVGDRMTGALVQPMAGAGVEMLIGATRDSLLGPVIALGAGGTLVELLGDVAFRLAPLVDSDPAAMIGELRCARLLRGYRGSAPVDETALRDTLLRVSALLELCPEICELDINPLIVQKEGAVPVDVRIRVQALPVAED